MANKLETVATALGKLRKALIAEGYTADQAFWIAQDLIRKGASPTALVDD
jgi:hypothetical protein